MAFPLDPDPTTLWTLHRDGKVASAVARFNLLGTEVQILRGDKVLYSRTLPSGEEASAWADEERRRMVETEGWQGTTPNVSRR